MTYGEYLANVLEHALGVCVLVSIAFWLVLTTAIGFVSLLGFLLSIYALR